MARAPGALLKGPTTRPLQQLRDWALAYSANLVERLSKKCGQPQNERLEAYETEQRGLISLRYDGDFCA